MLPPYLVASAVGLLAFAVSLVAFHQGGSAFHALGAFSALISVSTVAVLIYLNHLCYVADDMDRQIATRPIAADERKSRD